MDCCPFLLCVMDCILCYILWTVLPVPPGLIDCILSCILLDFYLLLPCPDFCILYSIFMDCCSLLSCRMDCILCCILKDCCPVCLAWCFASITAFLPTVPCSSWSNGLHPLLHFYGLFPVTPGLMDCILCCIFTDCSLLLLV